MQNEYRQLNVVELQQYAIKVTSNDLFLHRVVYGLPILKSHMNKNVHSNSK